MVSAFSGFLPLPSKALRKSGPSYISEAKSSSVMMTCMAVESPLQQGTWLEVGGSRNKQLWEEFHSGQRCEWSQSEASTICYLCEILQRFRWLLLSSQRQQLLWLLFLPESMALLVGLLALRD